MKDKLVAAARPYLGKCWHVATNDSFVSSDHMQGKVANDFWLYFGDRVATVPSPIKTEAARRLQLLGNLEPQLCCWEFILLCFYNAGILSKELIEQLCLISYVTKTTLVNAFYEDLLTTASSCEKNGLPKKGDILFFIRQSEKSPWHTAICEDDNGRYMGTASGPVARFQLDPNRTYDTQYFLSPEQVKHNILSYINKHQNIISNQGNASPPGWFDSFLALFTKDQNILSEVKPRFLYDFNSELRHTQYHDFVISPQEKVQKSKEMEIAAMKNQVFLRLNALLFRGNDCLSETLTPVKTKVAWLELLDVLKKVDSDMINTKYEKLGPAITPIYQAIFEKKQLPKVVDTQHLMTECRQLNNV